MILLCKHSDELNFYFCYKTETTLSKMETKEKCKSLLRNILENFINPHLKKHFCIICDLVLNLQSLRYPLHYCLFNHERPLDGATRGLQRISLNHIGENRPLNHCFQIAVQCFFLQNNLQWSCKSFNSHETIINVHIYGYPLISDNFSPCMFYLYQFKYL